MSQGEGDMRGSWNQGGQWVFIEDWAKQAAVDGGDGSASVKLSRADMAIAKKVAARTMFRSGKRSHDRRGTRTADHFFIAFRH
jgi:hypothetical protein